MYRIGDFIKTESKIVVARDEGRGKWAVTINAYRVSPGTTNVLESDSSNGCTSYCTIH